MQIDSDYKLEKLVKKPTAGDDEKTPLAYISIGKNGTATACNGVAIAVVPCAVGEGDVCGPITRDSLLHAREHTADGKSGYTNLHLRSKTTVVAEDSSEMPRSLKSVALKKDKQLELLQEEPPEFPLVAGGRNHVPAPWEDDIVMIINPTLLKKLAEALGRPWEITMRLRISPGNRIERAIRVDAGKAKGCIMPCLPADDDD